MVSIQSPRTFLFISPFCCAFCMITAINDFSYIVAMKASLTKFTQPMLTIKSKHAKNVWKFLNAKKEVGIDHCNKMLWNKAKSCTCQPWLIHLNYSNLHYPNPQLSECYFKFKIPWFSAKPSNKWYVCVILEWLGSLYHSTVDRKAY